MKQIGSYRSYLTHCGFSKFNRTYGLDISRNGSKRPDSMTLIPWSHGKSLLWDGMIRDILAHSYVSEYSRKANSIGDNAKRYKHNHYITLKENFYLFAFETFCMGCVD